MTLLRIDSSASLTGSVTRDLTDRIIASLDQRDVVTRDLARDPLPQIDQDWTKARATAPDERTADQTAALALSDTLVAELMAADTIVIGVPIYNFSVPAALKAWIDLVARVGVTFRYSPDGPQGLVAGKRVILAVASGGTPAGSDIDFATGYMRHVLAFMGMTEVEIIAADALAIDPEGTLERAHAAVAELPRAA